MDPEMEDQSEIQKALVKDELKALLKVVLRAQPMVE